jgi:hypothetical protein
VDITGGSVTVGSTGAFTFTPDANFNGTATFTYTVSDGTATDAGSVTITVTPVADPLAAVNDTATTTEDTAVNIQVATLLNNDTGDNLEITAVSNAVNGTAVLDDNGTADPADDFVTFDPADGFTGSATFDYTLEDGTGTDTATVTVTVTAAANAAPDAVPDTAEGDEDEGPIAGNVLTNDTDADADTLTVTEVNGDPANVGAAVDITGGSVTVGSTGAFTFTPDVDFNGTATFTYTVSDGTDTDTGSVTITVNAINDAPTVENDTASTAPDTAVIIQVATLLANDTDDDGDDLEVTAVSGETNGTAALDDNGTPTDPADDFVTFDPADGFTGTATFDYTVSDGTDTAVGTVTVTVGA